MIVFSKSRYRREISRGKRVEKLDNKLALVGAKSHDEDGPVNQSTLKILTASSPGGGEEGWKQTYEFKVRECFEPDEDQIDLVTRSSTDDDWPWFGMYEYNTIAHEGDPSDDSVLISYITNHSFAAECNELVPECRLADGTYDPSKLGQPCCGCRADPNDPCDAGYDCREGVCVEDHYPYYYYVPRFFRLPWADVRDFDKPNKVRCDKWSL